MEVVLKITLIQVRSMGMGSEKKHTITYNLLNPNRKLAVRIANENEKMGQNKIICEQDENIKPKE
jgi:hypothetical protein